MAGHTVKVIEEGVRPDEPAMSAGEMPPVIV
jgi:hypothetical protein